MTSKNGTAATNGKPDINNLGLLARFDTLERRLDELERQRAAPPNAVVPEDPQVFAQALQIVRQLTEFLKNSADANRLRLRLDTWPPSFARILIDAGVRCDASRREAVRRYIEILDDLRRHEVYLIRKAATHRQELEDSVIRWRRQLDYHQDTLRNLGITVEDVALGSPFDPLLHELVETRATEDATEIDRIAGVERSLFTWKDENGMPQCVPAQVVLFVMTEQSTSPT